MNPEEKRSLVTFCAICDELAASTFGRQFSVALSRTYRVQPNTLSSTRVRRFHPDAFRSFLLSFRKLLLQREPAYLYRVMSILGRYGDATDRERLRKIRRELDDVGESVAGVGFGIGDPPRFLRPKEAADTLFNGVLFHNDEALSADVAFYWGEGSHAMLPLLHYVVFIHKQTQRLAGAIRARGLVPPYA
jgi:hypothetical protein